MSGFQAGTAFVEVTASFRGWDTALAAQSRTLGAFGDQVGKQVGDSVRDGIARGIKSGLGEGFAGAPAESSRKGRESGDAFAGEFDRQIQTKIRAALASLPKVDITADSSEAERKIAQLRASLAELSTKKIGVDISEADALAKIRQIRAELQKLGDESPSIKVKADTAAAAAQLEAIQKMVDRVDGTEARLKVDADTAAAAAKLEAVKLKAEEAARNRQLKIDADTAGATAKLAALGAAASGAGGSFSPLIAAGIALGPAIIPVAAGAAAALAAIGTAAAGAAAGFGVAFLALKPIIGAVQALGAADASAATDAATAATAAKAKANAIENANAQVTSSEASLGNARASVASAAVNAAERVKTSEIALGNTRDTVAAAAVSAAQRVGDAQRGLADAHTQAAQGVQTALGQVTSAERTLAQAQQSELAAQQALTDARKSAQQQLQDYQTQLADGALSQRAALLGIQSAKENLDKVNASGTSTQLQRDQAKLAYDQAVQHNTDLGVQQARLKASAADAAKAGIEGSRQVVAAKTAVSQADQNIAASEKALASARAGVVAAQVKGAEQIAKAQEGVATAQRAQVEQQRQGAAQIVTAQQAVASSQRAQADQARQGAASIAAAQASVASAQRSLADAYDRTSNAGVSSANKVALAFAGLSPVGATFARFIYGLKDEFRGLSEAAQNGLLPGLQTFIEALLPSLPGLITFVGKLAKVMGDLFVEASKALTGPFWTQFFDFIGGSAAGWLDTFARTFGQLVKGAAGLFQALSPVADLFNASLLDGSKAFADWATSLGTNTGFQTFLGYIKDNLPLVLGFFGDLFRAVGNIIKALAPFGPVILQVVGSFAKFIANMDPKLLGQIAFTVGVVGLAFAGLPGILILVVGGLTYALTHFEGFRDTVINAFFSIRATVFNAWQNYIRPALEAMWLFIRDTLIPVFQQAWTAIENAWTQHIQPALQALAAFIKDRVVPAVSGIVDAIRKFLDVALPIVIQFVEGMRARIEPLMPQIKAIFGQIGDIIVGALDLIKAVIERVTVVISFIWRTWGQNIMDFIAVVFQAVLNVIRPALDLVMSIVRTFIAVFHGDWSGAWEGVKSILSNAWQLIEAIVRGAMEIIFQIVSTAWSAVKTFVSWVWEGITKEIGLAWEGIKSLIAGALFAVNAEVTVRLTAIKAFIQTVWNAISEAVDTVWQGIVGAIGGAIFAVKVAITVRLNEIQAFMQTVWNAIGDAIDKVWAGIRGAISDAWDNILGNVRGTLGLLQIQLGFAWAQIQTGVREAWQGAVDTIAKIWDTVIDKIKGPLRTVLNFINDNLIKPLNTLLGAVGIQPGAFKIEPIVVGFADGGLVARYAAGGTVGGHSPHDRADNILIRATAREFVQPVSAVDYYGTNVMEGMQKKLIPRELFSGAGAHADGGPVRGYADGGSVWDAIKAVTGMNLATRGASEVSGFISDPVGKFKELVGQLLSGIGSGAFAEVAQGAMTKFGDGLGAKVQSMLTAVTGGGGVGAAVNVGAGQVSVAGRLLDATTAGIFERASAALGGLSLLQGSWSTSVGASGGTHSGSGAMDVWPADGNWRRAVDVLRSFGDIAWHRTPDQGPWAEHIHGITPGIPGLSAAAQNQVANYYADRNGLVGNGPDNNGYGFGGVVKPILLGFGGVVKPILLDSGNVVKPLLADNGTILSPGLNLLQNNTGGLERLERTDLIRDSDISQATIMRIAAAMGGVTVRSSVTASTFDHAMGALL